MSTWPVVSIGSLANALRHFEDQSGESRYRILCVFGDYIRETEKFFSTPGDSFLAFTPMWGLTWLATLSMAALPADVRDFLDKLDVSDLDRAVKRNYRVFGAASATERSDDKAIYCEPRISWLVQCALSDIGDSLEKEWAPLFTRQPVPLKTDYQFGLQEKFDQERFGTFPQLTSLIESCTDPSWWQTTVDREKLLYMINIILTIAFDAFDAYHSASSLGHEPTDQERDLAMADSFARYSSAISYHFSPLPVEYREHASEHIAHGTFFGFIWHCTLPALLGNGISRLQMARKLFDTLLNGAIYTDAFRFDTSVRDAFQIFCDHQGLDNDDDSSDDEDDDDDEYFQGDEDLGYVVAPDAHTDEVWEELELAEDVAIVPYGPLIPVSDYTRPASMEDEDEDCKCLVCQYGLAEEPAVAMNACGHSFHEDCISAWINSQTKTVTCPYCRAVICEPRESKPDLESTEEGIVGDIGEEMEAVPHESSLI